MRSSGMPLRMQKIYLVLVNRQQKAPAGLAPVWQGLFLSQCGLSITVIHCLAILTFFFLYLLLRNIKLWSTLMTGNIYNTSKVSFYYYFWYTLKLCAICKQIFWRPAASLGRERVSQKTSRLNLFSPFARSELVWIRSKPLMGRHLWLVEIPHSCSLATAPYVILPSVPQKTLKLHLDVDADYFQLSEDTSPKRFLSVWRCHADTLTSLPFLKDNAVHWCSAWRGHIAPN